MIRFARILTISLLCCIPAWATVRNVQTCGATGNGTTDDTAAINTCIGQLTNGDTLEFPAGTYLVSSQLTINVAGITIDGSNNTATIINKSGTTTGILIGQGGIGNTNGAIGSPVALNATANETSTSFTTTSSLGASIGSYVYLQQGGQASSGGSTNYQCDTSGCRGEVAKVCGASGNTYTVCTMLHDTYVPSSGYSMSKAGTCTPITPPPSSGNCATAYLITGMLSGVTLQNITFDGNGGPNSGVTYGMEINDLVSSTISGVTIKNVQGAAIVSSVMYGNSWSNITITGAGSAGCGGALTVELESNDVWNTASLSSLNPGAPGTGCLNNGAFGVEWIGADVNNSYSNISVNSAGTSGGRPMKLTAARWNTFTSTSATNGCCTYNGMSLEYYSSHNLIQGASFTNNGGSGTGNGSAGLNFFANYVQYNTVYNLTASGNGNVQFVTGNADTLGVVADQNNAILGGTFTGSNAIEPAIISGEPNFYIAGATISGGSHTGAQGISLNASSSSNCVNSNTFVASSGLTGGAISSSSASNVGAGNTLNGFSSNLTNAPCPSTTQGSGALASLSVSSIAYGNQAVGQVSASQSVTLTNGIGPYSGTNTLIFGSAPSLTLGTQFAISASTCGGTVPAGGTCTVTLTFTPTSTGAQSDTLTFLDNAGGADQTVALSGTGLAPATRYYVSSSSGSDANNGTSAATPWATLGAHVNGGTFAAGDVIYLKRGDTWNEQLVPPSPGTLGNPISFDAYGTGAAPVLTPIINLTGASWAHNSGNIYTTTLSTAIASPQINNLQLGKLWGRKRSPNPGCTSAGVILGYGDFCVVYPTLYVYSPNGTLPSTYYSSIVPVVGQASGLAVVSIAGKPWITVQHIKIQSFDYMGVSVTGASDNLVFANMEVDGMVPYGATPLGFYVNAANPTNIQFINDDAYLNYDGFRFDGTATAITVVNCRGYANRDTGLKDSTGHATYAYSHFYGNNVAQFPASDVVGGIAGSGNVSSAIAPVVTTFATYPARFSFTVDDVGSQPNTESYINSLPVVFAAHGTGTDKFNAAVVPSYSVDWNSVNAWYTAGNEIDSHSWSHQYYTTNISPQNAPPYPNAPGLMIQYTGSGTAATLTIAGGMLSTAVTGAGDSIPAISLSSYTAQQLYTYLQALPHYSVQQNSPLWVTNSWPLSRPNAHATNLASISNQDIKTAPYAVLYDQTKLVPDELAASKSAIQANVPGLSEAFYVYPDGIEDPMSEADAIAAGYTAARGSLAMKGQDNATGSANSLYSNGVNVQNIASLAAIQIHGLTQAQINQMAASLVFRAAAWGIPYGFFTHYNSRGDGTPDISNAELGYLLDAVTANGGVWLTNTGIANALTAGTGLSGTTRYVQNPTGGVLDLTVAGANSPAVGRGAVTTYAVDLNGTNRATLGTWDIGASTYLSQRYGGGAGGGNTYIGGWPITGMAQLPQNWVNANEWVGTTTNTISFPATGSGGSWSCGATNRGPYTANSSSSLQQAVNDAEACRTTNGSGTKINIPAGAVFSNTVGISLPQTAGDTSTNFIVLTSASPLPAGQTVCSHGIQDNVSASTQPGIRNLGCNGSSMSYQLGATITPVSGAFTLANGTATNTSAYNDLASMYTIQCTQATCNGIYTSAPDANGMPPHHFAILEAEVRPVAGLASPNPPVKIGQGTETAVTQIPTHIHFAYDYIHGDWADAPVSGGVATGGATGANSIPNGIVITCITCSVSYSYLDRMLRPGSEGHGIYLQFAQQTKIVHNWVEGQSIGLFVGGYSSTISLVNFNSGTDMEDRANRYTYPYSWILANAAGFCPNNLACSGNGYGRKNSHELKGGYRVLDDGNINENIDNSGGQSGIIESWKTNNNSSAAGQNYFIVMQHLTHTNGIGRNGCNGPSWGFRAVTDSGNGGGVTGTTSLAVIQNNLDYNVSSANPGCSGSSNLGFRINNNDGNTWAASAVRDSTGTIATLTLTSVPGGTQSNMNAGDPVTVTGCTDATFNTTTTGLTPALTGTAATTLTVVYPNAGTANASTAGCTFNNLQGWPQYLLYSHNSDFVNDGTNPVSPSATANATPLALSRNLRFVNSVFVGGGVNSTFGEGGTSATPRTEQKAFDPNTLVLNNDLFPGRDSQVTCPAHPGTAAGGMAACYTEYSNSSVPSTPATLYGVPSSYCSGNDPTTGNCVGVLGAMSQGSFPAVLNDWHQYRLCHVGDPACNNKASLYAAGQANQGSDGADLGANVAAIDAAETATQYVCQMTCGNGPSGDVVSTGH